MENRHIKYRKKRFFCYSTYSTLYLKDFHYYLEIVFAMFVFQFLSEFIKFDVNKVDKAFVEHPFLGKFLRQYILQ